MSFNGILGIGGKMQTDSNGKPINVSNGLAIGNRTRKIVKWNIPAKGFVEMYINPQSLSISEKKLIKETRTKGGYIVQYWGEQLPEMTINGITGSGGIEGINVLRDIYRQEQLSFAELAKTVNQNVLDDITKSITDAISSGSTASLEKMGKSLLNSVLPSGAEQAFNVVTSDSKSISATDKLMAVGSQLSSMFLGGGIPSAFEPRQLVPTLGTLATSVEMWYDGMIYRGFFRDFTVTEKVESLGIFDYSIHFAITRQTGTRYNGFPWQRSVQYGPADASTIPLSYGAVRAPGNSSSSGPITGINSSANSVSRRGSITGNVIAPIAQNSNTGKK